MKVSVRTLVSTFGVMALIAGCSKSTEPGVATSISVSAPSLTFTSLGQQQQIMASVLDQNGHAMTGQTINFVTNSPAVATVNAATGVVTSVNNGTTSINVGSGTLLKTVAITVGQTPNTLGKTGDNQTGTQGLALTSPITVNVKDAGGAPIPNVSVSFAVTSGGGQVSPTTAFTDLSGNASSTWTMGPGTGGQGASATVGTLAPVTFTANAVAAGIATQVVLFVGNNQTALVGYKTNFRPAIRVLDAGNNPISGKSVTFAVTGGGGVATGLTATTNANGVAQVGGWTVGAAPASNTMTATVTGSGLTGNPATFTVSGVVSGYHITIQNVGPPFNAPVQAAFDSAVAFWRRVIIVTTQTETVSSAAGTCGGANAPAINQTVQDVLILARIDSIDGPNKILGQAGPCQAHSAVPQISLGAMTFDSADITALANNGSLNQVIRHEMGHVLGFGTIWDQVGNNCVQAKSSTGSPLDTFFSCASGRAAFDSIGGTSYTGGSKVPVENCGTGSPAQCGSGTYNAHWRENTATGSPLFGTELMTGFLNSGQPNPVSLVTIAAMEDLGYKVNYGAAETYNQVFTVAGQSQATGTRINLGNDILVGPFFRRDPSGNLIRLR